MKEDVTLIEAAKAFERGRCGTPAGNCMWTQEQLSAFKTLGLSIEVYESPARWVMLPVRNKTTPMPLRKEDFTLMPCALVAKVMVKQGTAELLVLLPDGELIDFPPSPLCQD